MAPSPNPILDEIDRAHQSLSPPAQQAIEQAHGMLGAPPIPGLPVTMGSAAQPQQAPSPIAGPPARSVPTLPPSQPSPDVAAHTAELNRLEGSKSGIGAIKSPFARIPLQIAQGIGSAFLPGLTMALPGTDLHHQLLVHEAQRAVGNDQHAAAQESENQLRSVQAQEGQARIPLIGAQTAETQAKAQKEGQPEPEEFSALPTATGLTSFNKRTGTANPLTVNGEQAQPFEKEQAQKAAIHVLPDGNVVSIVTDPQTGESTAHVVYKGDPKVESHVANLDVNGKSHQVLVNTKTGETIKDLGPSGEKPPSVNVNAGENRKFQEAERGRGLLDKAEQTYRTAAQSADELSNFISMAKAGNKVAAQASPLEGTLAIVTSQGVRRINRTEVEQVQGAGSLFDQIMAKVGKWTQGQPIPPDLQDDFTKLASALKKGAYQTYRGSFDSAKKRYGLGDEEQALPDPGGGGTVNMRSPDGVTKPVPADQVEHYKKLGATVVK